MFRLISKLLVTIMNYMNDKMHTLKGTKGLMSEPVSPTRILPSFTLTQKDLPVIKNWKVGKKYKLEVEVEQISSEKAEYIEGQPLEARFRIHKVRDVSLTNEEMMARKGL